MESMRKVEEEAPGKCEVVFSLLRGWIIGVDTSELEFGEEPEERVRARSFIEVSLIEL